MKVVYYGLKGIKGVESSYKDGMLAFAKVFYNLSSIQLRDLRNYGNCWGSCSSRVELTIREVEED
jgi:hypothetical protein